LTSCVLLPGEEVSGEEEPSTDTLTSGEVDEDEDEDDEDEVPDPDTLTTGVLPTETLSRGLGARGEDAKGEPAAGSVAWAPVGAASRQDRPRSAIAAATTATTAQAPLDNTLGCTERRRRIRITCAPPSWKG
jgi:hypothetical protein